MKITMIKIFMEADTKEEMVMKQLVNNTERNTWFDYSTPIKEDNKYITWYFDDIEKVMR